MNNLCDYIDRQRIGWAAVIALITIDAGAVTLGQIDDFEDGTVQGWIEGAGSDNPPTNEPGGPPGSTRYLSNVSSGVGTSGGKMTFFNETQWTGDFIAAGITEIRAIVRVDPSSDGPLNLRIGFRAASEFGMMGHASLVPIVVPDDGNWYEVVFPIGPSDLVPVDFTSLNYTQTLSDVGHMRFLNSADVDWQGQNSSAILGIDNITAGRGDTLPAIDLTSFADVSGDGVTDLASFVDDGVGGVGPQIEVHSGANGSTVSTIGFFNPAWTAQAIDSAADGNSDGTANDPALVLLGFNPATSATIVQVRMAQTGAFVRNIQFFNPAWTPLDIVVINDVDGNGNTNDAAIGVLGLNEATSAIGFQFKRLSNGSTLATHFFLNPAWSPVAAAALSRAGQTPLIAVMAVNPVTGATVVQSRQFSNGALQGNAFFFNTAWRGVDVAVETDLNSNGTANDPAWMVLATNDGTGNSAVQVRNVNGGAVVKTIFFLNPAWEGSRVTGAGDISGNTISEVAAMARNRSNDNIVIQVKDYGTTAVTQNIFP